MDNLRQYGQEPFIIAVIHGGPGAPGSMAPVARELAAQWGVLEPLQTADSLDGQVDELRDVLTARAQPPVTLIGSSWGAMLSYIVAARHPALVKKLILVGSAGYELYGDSAMTKRMMRLSAAERDDVRELQEQLRNPAVESAAKNAALARLGQMFTENTDTFNPITFDTEVIEVRYDIHERVWSAAAALRRSGRLLDLGHDIQCPVLAIHGDYDPHPADEIRKPLSDVIKDFRFILLKHCGHYPWLERDARDKFFDVIREEIGR